MELPDARPADRRNRAASAEAPGSRQCRELLTELLRPIDKDGAEAIARQLIGEFGSLAAVLAADDISRVRVLGPGSAVSRYLGVVHAAMLQSLRREMLSKPVLGSTKGVIEYLRFDMAYAPVEQFRVLFLNRRNRLLRDEVMGRGTIGEAPIYPREVIRRALDVGATALLLVHNHPSGDPTPSKSDVVMTQRIIRAAQELDITVHDHLLIARSGWKSFRQEGLI
ncbi:JAB domain-containing protein [Sphingomonas sp. ID0503]|uniref:JAB domain-containing protein n=1 Tax=Sphingomonas sp. ID0503 TaxID=3399691 RepID=UPI003AFAAF08